MEYLLFLLLFGFIGYGVSRVLITQNFSGNRMFIYGFSVFISINALFVTSTLDFYLKGNLFSSVLVFCLVALSLYKLKEEMVLISDIKVFNIIKNEVFLFIAFTFLMYLYLFGGDVYVHSLGVDFAAYISAVQQIQGFKHGDPIGPITYELVINAKRVGLVGLGGYLHSILELNTISLLNGLVFSYLVSGVTVFTFLFLNLFNLQNNKILFYVIAIFILCNVNIIYLLEQAFLPQVLAIVLFSAIVAYDLNLRELTKTSLKGHIPWFTLLVSSVFVASLITNYSEYFILLLAYYVGMLFFDVLFKNYNGWKSLALVVITLVVGLLLVFPQTKEIIHFTLANSANFRSIGYPFPNYMTFSDLIGITNLFSDMKSYLDVAVATHLVHDGVYPTVFKELTSVIIVMFLFYLYFKNNKFNYLFVVVLGIFSTFVINLVLFNYFNGIENYLFNKISIAFSMILISSIVVGIYIYFAKYFYKIISILLLLTLVSVGLYLNDRHQYTDTIPKNLTLAEKTIAPIKDKYVFMFNERGYRNGKIIGRLRYIDRNNDFILSSLLHLDAIDQWNVAQWNSISAGKGLAFIIKKSYLNNNFSEPFITGVLSLGGGLYVVTTSLKFDSIRASKDLSKIFLR